MMKIGWVYIITNRPNGVLYVGVTSGINRRAWEHRTGAVDGFSKKHDLKRLVFVEQHDDIKLAIQREKNIKGWSRVWKVRLIHGVNPHWEDLYDQLG
mgnify:FL=1|jgi:putative endonuclease